MGNSVKKMKPGKLTGPSHKNGGILLEAEGGEYIIKKSSVKKIGKDKLDKINKEGKIPMATKVKGARKSKSRSKVYSKKNPSGAEGNFVKGQRIKGGNLERTFMSEEKAKSRKRIAKLNKMGNKATKFGSYKYASGGKVGDSIKTYSNGGYVEGE